MSEITIRNKVTLLRDFLNNVGTMAGGVEVDVTQDSDNGLRFFAPVPVATTLLDGKSASATATSIPLCVASDDMPLTSGVDDLGVPVLESMTAQSVAVTWKSDNTGGDPGNWTLRLHKRQAGGQLIEAATFTVHTNNN